MNDKAKTKKTVTDSVDQIRDILFGEQVEIIENKISQLENTFKKSIEQLSKKMDEINKNLQTENTDLSGQLSTDISQLEKSLQNKIVETESDVLNQIQAGLQKLENKASHRNDLAQLLKEMADKLAD